MLFSASGAIFDQKNTLTMCFTVIELVGIQFSNFVGSFGKSDGEDRHWVYNVNHLLTSMRVCTDLFQRLGAPDKTDDRFTLGFNQVVVEPVFDFLELVELPALVINEIVDVLDTALAVYFSAVPTAIPDQQKRDRFTKCGASTEMKDTLSIFRAQQT